MLLSSNLFFKTKWISSKGERKASFSRKHELYSNSYCGHEFILSEIYWINFQTVSFLSNAALSPEFFKTQNGQKITDHLSCSKSPPIRLLYFRNHACFFIMNVYQVLQTRLLAKGTNFSRRTWEMLMQWNKLQSDFCTKGFCSTFVWTWFKFSEMTSRQFINGFTQLCKHSLWESSESSIQKATNILKFNLSLSSNQTGCWCTNNMWTKRFRLLQHKWLIINPTSIKVLF